MAGLRIGIDVGGTFTHGVVLRPPGTVIARARTATTHSHDHGVAAGVQQVLSVLLEGIDAAEVELVAHSTTQATNALLEGDVTPVNRVVLVPPGENMLCRMALGDRELRLAGDRSLPVATTFIPLEMAASDSTLTALLDEGFKDKNVKQASGDGQPAVAVVQPLAGGHASREGLVAQCCSAMGYRTVQAAEITQVLGLAARTRTATVNASMLPTMLATADYTERAVGELLPEVPLQVVRSDGGAMGIDEMRAQPILSLLSGPAAGASAALDRTGLSEVVFIEVGGTSTDITLINEGRVRHRYATVGTHQLMVPALDLRTVAVGGGSMLRADGSGFGPRSAHIAGMPYLFQALLDGRRVVDHDVWYGDDRGTGYQVAILDDGTKAALTLTDYWMISSGHGLTGNGLGDESLKPDKDAWGIARELMRSRMETKQSPISRTTQRVMDTIRELGRTHSADLANCRYIFGGGGAPVLRYFLSAFLPGQSGIVDDHAVISAIGAALAVTCASQQKTVAQPTGSDIAELTTLVTARLRRQGADRVATDYEFDAQRQVLTVTGHGSRAYQQDLVRKDLNELTTIAATLAGEGARCVWEGGELALFTGPGPAQKRLGVALDIYGRSLWLGKLREWNPADGQERQGVLDGIIDSRTAYTDGGPALPGLALLCSGRFIPLDQLGSRSLINEVLQWENLPADAPGCFLIRD